MKTKLLYYPIFLIIISELLFSACNDDFEYNRKPEIDLIEDSLVETNLNLSVSNFFVSSSGTRVAEPNVTDKEPTTPEENKISNIWVFQYDEKGDLMIRPRYYKVPNESGTSSSNSSEDSEGSTVSLRVLLKNNVNGEKSRICVVANTSYPNWITDANISDFSTVEQLQSQSLYEPMAIKLSEFKPIPMEGSDLFTITDNSDISVTLKRMYAKLKIKFIEVVDGMRPVSIEVKKTPFYCSVKSLGDSDSENAAIYPDNTEYSTYSFNTDSNSEGNEYEENNTYVIYVPENIKGESDNSDEAKRNEKAPANSIQIKFTMKYKDPARPNSAESTYEYYVFPGGNKTNNFNIRRNSVYRVNLSIKSLDQAVHTPSANCMIAYPGTEISFEPYNRDEVSDFYDFSDYLDPAKDDLSISTVKIIWQTKDAIGDNSNEGAPLAWFEKNEETPKYSKIYVKTNKEGNALIGGYNSKGDLLWSWHIWITTNDPGNVGNAIFYTTYRWDSKGIKTNEARIPGYAVMRCNLGALSSSHIDKTNDFTPNSDYCKKLRSYGMLYQWGRKDPFPPYKSGQSLIHYTKKWSLLDLYGNANNDLTTDVEYHDIPYVDDNEVSQTYRYYNLKLFNRVLVNESNIIGNSNSDIISYTVKHPTTFIAAADFFGRSNDRTYSENYINQGDWLPDNDERLWGGVPSTEEFKIANGRYIRRNYGPNKTIFDPCPRGWRVPPGDLWMGLTNTGKGGYINEDINNHDQNLKDIHTKLNIPASGMVFDGFTFDDDFTVNNEGYLLCLNGWHNEDVSKYSFFPMQGTRIASSQPFGRRNCGNYHNATYDGLANYTKGGTISTSGEYQIRRVNILHLHKTNKYSMYIDPFEQLIWYTVKSVACPIRCVRDTK